MRTFPMKRVTVVAEALLEDKIVADLRRLGARGWTILEARGHGSRGVRASDWEGRNVQVETIVPEETAQTILTHVAATYFEHYAVIAYVDAVDVVRSAKYE